MGVVTNAVASGVSKLRTEETVSEKEDRIDSEQETIVGVKEYKLEGEEKMKVNGHAMGKICDSMEKVFASAEGRQSRTSVEKIGHGRGSKVIANDVDMGSLIGPPAEVTRRAVDADVHSLGHTLVLKQIEKLTNLKRSPSHTTNNNGKNSSVVVYG